MTKLYLITGFLGSGKTTLLRGLLEQFKDRRVAVIVNEFGRVGVDGALLAGQESSLTEITSGSIFCSCRLPQFEDALTALEASAPELIFVEASGLSDPTAVRAILDQPARFGWFTYAGALCLADAPRFQKLYQSARVCRMQFAEGDLIVINKTDLASPEQLDAIRAAALAQKPGRPVYETTYGKIEPEWLERLSTPGPSDAPAEIHTRDLTLRRLALRAEGGSRDEFQAFLQSFCDETYRVKGFVKLDGGVFLADCVGPVVSLVPAPAERAGESLTVLYGNGLRCVPALRRAMESFPGIRAEILPET